MSFRAICHWCAAEKSRAFVVCQACGEMPAEGNRIVAWLLSDAYLSESELCDAQSRLKKGALPAPTEGARRIAQRALGLDIETDRYAPPQIAALLVLCVVFSSILGIGLWWSKRHHRPLKARQLLGISFVAGVVDLFVLFYKWSF